MLEEKLLSIMTVIFDLPQNSLNKKTDMYNCDSWDSMNHMNLILALEEDFGIKISDDEAVDLISFEKLHDYLKMRK